MPKGQSIEKRIDALLPFADCINKYLEVDKICKAIPETWERDVSNGMNRCLGGALC